MEKTSDQLKPHIAKIIEICKEFENLTNSLASEWKDERKDEFYRKYVSQYNDNNRRIISEINTIENKLNNIHSKLKIFERS